MIHRPMPITTPKIPLSRSWIKNSRLKASDVGLTEEPYAPPCDVVFLPGCPGGPP